MVLGGETGSEVLRLLDDRQRRVDMDRTLFGRNEADFRSCPEQDVLNAILCTRVDPDRVDALENRLAPNPPFAGLRLADEATLRCQYADGTEPYVLHHFHRKPWLAPMYHGLFSRLLARLLLGRTSPCGRPPTEVPLRMRRGPIARVERAGRRRRRLPARPSPNRDGTLTEPAVAFYAVTGRDFFGAVALLNSLRLLGHDEPLLVVDCGMTARQRELLAEHATALPAPSRRRAC